MIDHMSIRRRGSQADHRHGTSYFRGWICKQCNTGLGGLGDGILSAFRLVRYLIYNELNLCASLYIHALAIMN